METRENSTVTEPTLQTPPQEPSSAPVPLQLITTGNLAAARCMQVYEEVYEAELARGTRITTAKEHAAQKYRTAIPAPAGRDGIRNFIACVAHGVLLGAIIPRESTALLYAAQVAQSTLRVPAPPDPKRY